MISKKVQTIFFQPSAFVSPFPLCAQSHEETERRNKNHHFEYSVIKEFV